MVDAPVAYPPPDMRKIIDKTAEFVAQHGPEFEKKAQREGNEKFKFLFGEHPFRPYYDMRLQQFKDGVDPKKEAVAPKPQVEESEEIFSWDLCP